MQKSESKTIARLTADAGMVLHKVGTDIYARAVAVRIEDVSLYEEVSEAQQAEAERTAKVQEKYVSFIKQYIAEQYSIEDELALINNYNADSEAYANEYAEYQAYRKACKARAKAEAEEYDYSQDEDIIQ